MLRCFCKILFPFLSVTAVYAQPNAAFTFVNACKGKPVQFTDQSTSTSPDTIVSRSWLFGDGGSSTLINPTRTYSTYGVFEVRLIVTTVSGLKDTVYHDVETYAVPDAVIAANPFTGCQPLEVQFVNNSTIDTGSISNWLWDFDDGSTSTQQAPLHTFWELFGHTVKLVATSNKGCKDSTTRDVFVLQNPVCDFTASLVSLNDSNPIVNFTNLSSGGNVDLVWDFGDGNTSTEYSLLHTYDTCGSYNVVLTATGTNTCVTVADYILEVCDTLVQIYNSVDDPSTTLRVTINVFPNPSNGGSINMSYELSKEEIVSISVFDLSGKLMAAPITKTRQQQGKHVVELTGDLPAGMYLLSLNASGKMYSERVIVTQ